MPADPTAGSAMFPAQGEWIDIPEDMHTEFAQLKKGVRMTALMKQLKTAARRRTDDRPVFTDGPVESLLARTNPVSIGLSYSERPNDSFPGAPTPCWYLSIAEHVPGVGLQAASDVDLVAMDHGRLPDSDAVREIHHGHWRGATPTDPGRADLATRSATTTLAVLSPSPSPHWYQLTIRALDIQAIVTTATV